MEEIKTLKYMEVIRELVHSIPSQPAPQGSVPSQLGGVFCHSFTRASRAAAASEIKKPIKYILNLHTKIVTEGKSQSIQFFSQLEKQVEYF